MVDCLSGFISNSDPGTASVTPVRFKDASPPATHPQVLLTIQSQQLLVVHDDALTGKHDPKPTIAEPTTFKRDLAKTRPKVAIITTPGRVAHRRPINSKDGTGPTLADVEGPSNLLDGLALNGRPHQFFEATSFSTALSSIASASSRFNLPFSSSRTFSLRACDTSMPPYVASHL